MWSINSTNYPLPTVSNNVAIDVCVQLGYDIPRFCYHNDLKVAGNCRMCLIEDTKAAKPIICCAMQVTDGLSIYTNTVRVKKARESVLEFLLINHPLDCPICDQGGECDLQDLSLVYGADQGRFYEYKRNIEDKNSGAIVKTVMNRCILCTRCVRFAIDVAGFKHFGLTGRGAHLEIGSYVEKLIDTDLSGNLIDICPVGALTSKPYAFAARPWELKKVNSINVLDDAIQSIRLDVKDNELLRITPSKNSTNLNAWITNRTRFSYEGLKRSRVVMPAVLGANVNWNQLLRIFAHVCKSNKSAFVTNSICFSDILSIQDLLMIKYYGNSSASSYNYQASESLYHLFIGYPNLFKSNTTVVVLNADLRYQAPVLSMLLKSTAHVITVVAWRSTGFYRAILLPNSLQNLIYFFRAKVWQTFIIGCDNTHCFVNLASKMFKLITSLSTNLNMNFINFFISTTQRGAAVLNFSAINSQNGELYAPFLIHRISNLNSSRVPLSFSQTTSTRIVSDFLVPVSTIYEQANAAFFDTDYTIVKTARAVVSLFKSHQNVVKAISSILVPSELASPIAESYSAIKHFYKEQIPLPTFSRLRLSYSTSISYYNAYSITANSPALVDSVRNENFLKNIYLT